MSGFWDKKGVKTQEVAYQEAQQVQEPLQLDEQALAEIQGEEFDVFEDEEEDTSEIMFDANLRLEQGRLYQMIMRHDLFGETDADPKAIRNVQREIRKFVRERMETMLGIRQEQAIQEVVVSSPFNDMEVTVLRMLASKMSKGATEEPIKPEPIVPVQPKRDGITTISGNLRAHPSPISKPAFGTKMAKSKDRPVPGEPIKTKAKSVTKSAINNVEEESLLQKSIDDMTPEELAAHDAAALERRSKNYATMPNNLTPHPTGAALEMLYVQQLSQTTAPGTAVSKMMELINGR
jgi:hypothetical protein